MSEHWERGKEPPKPGGMEAIVAANAGARRKVEVDFAKRKDVGTTIDDLTQALLGKLGPIDMVEELDFPGDESDVRTAQLKLIYLQMMKNNCLLALSIRLQRSGY